MRLCRSQEWHGSWAKNTGSAEHSFLSFSANNQSCRLLDRIRRTRGLCDAGRGDCVDVKLIRGVAEGVEMVRVIPANAIKCKLAQQRFAPNDFGRTDGLDASSGGAQSRPSMSLLAGRRSDQTARVRSRRGILAGRTASGERHAHVVRRPPASRPCQLRHPAEDAVKGRVVLVVLLRVATSAALQSSLAQRRSRGARRPERE